MSAPRVLVAGAVLGQPMGGVRRHNAELLPRLARLLDERGGGLAVLEGKERIPFELPAPIERLSSRVPASPPFARGVHETGALRAALAEARARGTPFDLVHTAHLPVPRALGVPLTLTIHDLRAIHGDVSTLARRFVAAHALRDAARGAQAFFTVSESTRAAIVEHLGVPRELVHVVPNAADHFEPLPRVICAGHPTLGSSGPDARGARDALLCLGHLEPRKNLALVLHALAHDRALPRVVFAGAAKSRHAEELDTLARSLGVRERVTFAGPFEDGDLARLYATCAAVVLPSQLEGFGIVALEAQRARAPLAIARIPALVEVAGADVPSFAPDDPVECARALRRTLLRDSNALDLDARNAARFTWDASARAWCDALCALHGAA
ncbi:MAG: glycosyltransferase family 4 protein [Planctomycetes bacterium]|nr:glycosyltransferase family 4 protein [Planctomycetota bacterium]